MKAFIVSHKKLCIILSVILILILACVIWIEVKIGFNNLPLNKTSGTVVSIYLPKHANEPTELLIKLDAPSSWPNCEYAYVNCTTDVGRILRTFKIKKNVEVTDNGKIII